MPERITREKIGEWEGFPPIVGEDGIISPKELVKLVEYIRSILSVEEENPEEDATPQNED